MKVYYDITIDLRSPCGHSNGGEGVVGEKNQHGASCHAGGAFHHEIRTYTSVGYLVYPPGHKFRMKKFCTFGCPRTKRGWSCCVGLTSI